MDFITPNDLDGHGHGVATAARCLVHDAGAPRPGRRASVADGLHRFAGGFGVGLHTIGVGRAAVATKKRGRT